MLESIRKDMETIEQIKELFEKINYYPEYSSKIDSEYAKYGDVRDNFEDALDTITDIIEKELHKQELKMMKV